MTAARNPGGAWRRALGSDALVLGIERLEYVPSELVLRLCLRLAFKPPSPSYPTLLVERDAAEHSYPALVAYTVRSPFDDAEWTWRGSFPLPAELCGGDARFALAFHDRRPLPLALGEGVFGGPSTGSPPTGPYHLRRAALMFAVACQLGLTQGWMAQGAVASGSYVASAGGQAGPEVPVPASGEPVETAPEAPPPAHPGAGERSPETPPQPPGPVSVPPAGTSSPTTDQGAGQASTPSASAPSPAAPVVTIVTGSTPAPTHAAGIKRTPRIHHGWDSRRRGHGSDTTLARSRRGTVAASPRGAEEPSSTPPLAELTPLLQGMAAELLGAPQDRPPAFLIPIYQAAGRRYHVPWRVLAAINAIETDYGRNLATSPAGAIGWMQFMPGTWREWAVDADHDGRLDPYSPDDAIFTAARYLHACGATHDLAGAIFAYNHATWYVAEVFLRARSLGDPASFARVERGYSLPLDARYMRQLGRTDDGVDIETAPDGALVYSITPGIVTAVASDPGGFGPGYPVIEATRGALAGRHIYYGHVAIALVHPGQVVSAGQPVAIMGHTGDAATLGHGHIEIGFSDGGGGPLNHHGLGAWTPAGDVMRGVLTALSSSFGIENS